MSARTYYVVLEAGQITFRAAIDTGSADSAFAHLFRIPLKTHISSLTALVG